MLISVKKRDVELEQAFSALSSIEPGIIQPQELAQALAGMTAGQLDLRLTAAAWRMHLQSCDPHSAQRAVMLALAQQECEQ